MSSSVLIFLKFGASLSYSRWIGRINEYLSILARFLSEGDGRSGREGIVGAGHEVERVAAISFFGLGSTTKQGELTSFSRSILVHQLQGGVSSGAQVQLGLRQRFFCSKEVLKKVRKRKLKRISLSFITANIRRDRKVNEK